MTTLTFQLPDETKRTLKQRAKSENVTITFYLNQLINYANEKRLRFSLIEPKDIFDETKDPDYMLLEKNPEIKELVEDLGNALDKKYKNKTFPSLEEQLKDV